MRQTGREMITKRETGMRVFKKKCYKSGWAISAAFYNTFFVLCARYIRFRKKMADGGAGSCYIIKQ